MSKEQTQSLIGTRSLTEHDIQVQLLQASTSIRAGDYRCQNWIRAETEACCAKYEHAGDIHLYGDGYACYVDAGTGDWD